MVFFSLCYNFPLFLLIPPFELLWDLFFPFFSLWHLLAAVWRILGSRISSSSTSFCTFPPLSGWFFFFICFSCFLFLGEVLSFQLKKLEPFCVTILGCPCDVYFLVSFWLHICSEVDFLDILTPLGLRMLVAAFLIVPLILGVLWITVWFLRKGPILLLISHLVFDVW